MKNAIFVIESGTVTALAGGPLSLADLGPRTTKRASTLEFHAGLNEWVVYDADTREPLFLDRDYDVALEWERVEFNRRLAAS